MEESKETKEDKTKVIKIVIVDDIKSICNSIRRELTLVARNSKDLRFKLVDFQEPEIAIQYILENKLDLLITDVKMPGVSGDKLVDAVKKVKADLPVIVITGFATKENILALYKADPKCIVIGKPWENNKLIQSIEKLLNYKVVSNIPKSNLELMDERVKNGQK